MDRTEARVEYPATSDEMTAALNAALEAGDLERIMGVMGEMARAHRMRRVARETGLGEKSLYKSMRAGASPRVQHRPPGAPVPGLPIPGPSPRRSRQ